LKRQITDFLDSNSATGIFAKISDKSAKHGIKLEPCFKLEDVFNCLTRSPDILRTLMKEGTGAYLILLPWDERINESNEFRVIIQDRQVVAISQQIWYKKVNMAADKCQDIAWSIHHYYKTKKDELPYNDCVLDVWVDEHNVTRLIEINPGSAWSSSGSALFHWINDFSLLKENDGRIYFRYVK